MGDGKEGRNSTRRWTSRLREHRNDPWQRSSGPLGSGAKASRKRKVGDVVKAMEMVLMD